MRFIRSTLFNIGYYTSLPIMCIFILIFFWNQRLAMLSGWYGCRITVFLMEKLAGIKVEIRGSENILKEPCIYASKHQSAMETLLLAAIVKGGTYVLKKELAYVPIFGWGIMTYGCVAIDRSSGAAAMRKLIKGCKRILDMGRSVLIFPEGTRTKPGESTKYRPGISMIYNQMDAKIVPVAINSGVFWPKKSYMKKSGTVVIEFLPAMPENLEKREFLEELKNRIEKKSLELYDEAKGNK